MYLYRYRRRPNFGDALNDYLWPHFLHSKLEAEAGSNDVFVGIGTLLNEQLPPTGTLHIFGAGLGYGSVSVNDMAHWKIYFVRGPLTARALRLDPALGIADPGILLHRIEDLNPQKDIECAFMPHHGLYSDRMKALCERAGVYFINPEASCQTVIDEIGRSRKLICSAMHGAITAEALRVPWLPVITHPNILLSKWQDWTEAMGMEIHFRRLPSIWSTPTPSIQGRLLARLKAEIFSKRIEQLKKSRHFNLGRDQILESRLRQIEIRISSFNEAYPKHLDNANS